MPYLKEQDIPVNNPRIENLKKLNVTELHNLGKFEWVFKDISSGEEIGMWFSEIVNGREINEWFFETDSAEELADKIENINAEERLFSILPEYKKEG